MIDSGLVELATVLFNIVVGVAAVIAGLYIAHVYGELKAEAIKRDALLLIRLYKRNIRVASVAGLGLGYIALVFSGFSLGRPWGGVFISLLWTALVWGVISDALLWWKERRAK